MEEIIVKYLQTHRTGLTVKECIDRFGMETRYKRYWLLSTPNK